MDKLYCVFDEQADSHGPLFQARNDNVAVRRFRQLLQKVPEMVREDYTLVCIGEYREDTGHINPYHRFQEVAKGTDQYLRKGEETGDIFEDAEIAARTEKDAIEQAPGDLSDSDAAKSNCQEDYRNIQQ